MFAVLGVAAAAAVVLFRARGIEASERSSKNKKQKAETVPWRLLRLLYDCGRVGCP